MRINKLLSNYGICSRKETVKLINDKKIIVNGEFAIQGQWVEEYDEIFLDKKILEPKEKVYIALNKPRGIVCTSSKEVKDNIIDYLNYKDYIFPVGRLDKESEGLILLTNDGDLANKILESENNHEKEYIVSLNRNFDDDFIHKMSSGLIIDNVLTKKCVVKRINENTFNIILTQGLNRQIRKMSLSLGYRVIFLKRIRIMNINLDEIQYGEYRYLSQKEISKLKKL